MASAERAYTTEHSYVAPSNYAEDYARRIYERSIYSHEESNTAKKQKERPTILEVPHTSEETKINRNAALGITSAMLARTIALLITIGIMLIVIVLVGAKATEIQYSINQTKAQSKLVEDEIAMLSIKIESSNGIESVEDYATANLRMRYPRNNQCIYLSDKQEVRMNLVNEIKSRAYKSA